MRRLKKQVPALAPRGEGDRWAWEGHGVWLCSFTVVAGTAADTQASNRASVIFSTLLLATDHPSVWGKEASRTQEEDKWRTK